MFDQSDESGCLNCTDTLPWVCACNYPGESCNPALGRPCIKKLGEIYKDISVFTFKNYSVVSACMVTQISIVRTDQKTAKDMFEQYL